MGQNHYPTTADVESANTLGTTASPLLAGFSITLIALVAGNTAPSAAVRFPNITLFILVIATMLFVLAVQFTVVAKKYYITETEYKNRTPMMQPTQRESSYSVVMEKLYFWIDLSSISFNLGLFFLFCGVAGVMWSPCASLFRLSAVCCAVFFAFGELFWFIIEMCKSKAFRKSLKKRNSNS